MNQEDLATELIAIKAQNEKARIEIVGKISTLEQEITNGGAVSEPVLAALADLKASVQGTDDIVPDAPVDVPVTVVPTL